MSKVDISKLAILVIDDHMIIRQVVEQNLRDMGFSHIDSVADSGEAEQRIAQQHYDIIFVDWVLPGKSGYTMMRELREDRKYDDVAFIMVTAETDERHMIEALKAGATSYITKPVTAALFQEKVGKVVEWIERKSSGGQATG